MKKILILGAGVYQVPLILKAQSMGLYTIVVSQQGNYPGFKYADKVYFESTTDQDKILSIAIKENIKAICTAGTDVAIGSLGYVAQQLNLPGINTKAAEFTTNKFLMKKAFKKHGVRSSVFQKVFTLNEARQSFSELQAPLMFKAVDSSGSRGVIKVDAIEDVQTAYEYAFSATKKDFIIVEEFISGIEFGAQSAVVNGKMEFIMPHGDFLFKGKTDVPIGHYVPHHLNDKTLKDLKEQIQMTVSALQLDNCALNFDFILKEDKVYLLEVGARVGATCLAEQVSVYYDLDYYEFIIKIALGEVENLKFVGKRANASLLFLSNTSGVFDSISYDKTKYDIVEVKFDYKSGEKINAFQVGPDRLGHIIIKGKDISDVFEQIEHLQKNYQINLTSYDTIQ